MGESQQFFTQLVYNISNLIPLGYAFGAPVMLRWLSRLSGPGLSWSPAI